MGDTCGRFDPDGPEKLEMFKPLKTLESQVQDFRITAIYKL